MSQTVYTPSTIDEAADIVRRARGKREALSIIGNGSKSAIGQYVDPQIARLSSSGLSGMVQYNPQELVFVAKAGTPLAEITKALESNNQQMIFEPANYSALLGHQIDQTIGGIAASNMSGPRRFIAGAARDSLLGVRFINGMGEHIKNGGQVMKNVTGLDLVKLMAGSWGGLGLLTEVSFKVLPKSETEKTLVAFGMADGDAAKLMAAAMATSCDVSGAAHLPKALAKQHADQLGADSAATLLRLEGFEESVKDRVVRLTAALNKAFPNTAIDIIDTSPSKQVWAAIRDIAFFANGSDKAVWRISAAPMQGAKIVAEIQKTGDHQAYYDWQGGLIWLQMASADPQSEIVRAALARNGGGHATLIRASEADRRSVAVFQPEPLAVQALSTRLQNSFDPSGVFHRSRIGAEIIRQAA